MRSISIMMASRGEVLGLYRAILRRGDSLKYTDKDFFKHTVRFEFRKCSRDTEPKVILRNIEVNATESYVSAFLLLFFLIHRKQSIFSNQI